VFNAEIVSVPFTANAVASVNNCGSRGHRQDEHRAEGSLGREETHTEAVSILRQCMVTSQRTTYFEVLGVGCWVLIG